MKYKCWVCGQDSTSYYSKKYELNDPPTFHAACENHAPDRNWPWIIYQFYSTSDEFIAAQVMIS
jgi:hypothetical protein